MDLGFVGVVGGGVRVRRSRVVVEAKKKRSGGKKGFQKKADNGKEVENKAATPFREGARKPIEDMSNFVPQGPTMKAYYEKTGKIATNPEDTLLPEVVSQRMLKRMIWLCGTPFTLGIVGFAAFFIAKTQYDVTFQPAVVAFSTLGMFGVALVGLTYGIMSASWDVDKEGSTLGFSEAKTNFMRTVDALSRSRSGDKDVISLDENYDADDR